MADQLTLQVEAIIFCSQGPITLAEIQNGLEEYYETSIPEEHIAKTVQQLEEKYAADQFSFEIVHTGGGLQFLTKAAFQPAVTTILKQKVKKKLSTAAMETLSIIAYRQPVSKPELEKVRGVNCDYAVQKLLEKELIMISGKSDLPGRPILYTTSQKFMDYFGINHITELPELKELAGEVNTVGEEIT